MSDIEMKTSPGECMLTDQEIKNSFQAFIDELLRHWDMLAEELGRVFMPPRRPALLTRMRSAYRRRKGSRW